MEFLLLREAIVLIAAALGAYTDWKTGLINDWITLPLIAIGIILNLFEKEMFLYYGVAACVFVVGYALYYLGKIGGGDVKLFTGIALVMPFLGGYPFVVTSLFVAAFCSVIALSAWFVSKYVKSGIDWKKNSRAIKNAALLAVFFGAYISITWVYGMASFGLVVFLAVLLAFGLPYMAFESGIREKFFLKRVALARLEEDEIIASEFLPEKIREKLGMKWKGVIGEKETELLKKMNLKKVPVYRGLPRFGPFILIGCAAAMLFPELLKAIFFIG